MLITTLRSLWTKLIRWEYNFAMSCSSFGLPSCGTLSSGSSETPFSFSHCVEGYDFEFVPPVESRYECPVCLLILREPRQTKCGHRFCRDCILRSLRDSCTRCPVDNEPLTENDLFPDNFAKREILNFTIRCPNSKDGCDKIIALGKLQNHIGECPLALVPCPFKCASILPRCDMDDHIRYKCEYRCVSCQHCLQQMKASDLQAHQNTCPKAALLCKFCGDEKTRDMINDHLEKECPQVEISCPLYRFGCTQQMPRMAENEHLQAEGAKHLKLLSQAVTDIIQQLETGGGNQLFHTDQDCRAGNHRAEMNVYPHSENLSALSSQLTMINLNSRRLQENLEANNLRNNSGPTSNEYDDGQNRITSAIYPPSLPIGRAGSDTNSPVPYVEYPTNSSVSLPYKCFHPVSLPPGHHSTSPVNNQNPPDIRQKRQLQRLNFQPHLHSGADLSGPLGNTDFSNAQEILASQESQNSMLMSTMEETSRKFEEKLAAQQQSFEELFAKCTALERINADLNKRVIELTLGMAEAEGRFVQGELYWRITDFKKYQSRAATGEQTMLHSPPFYTSPWGYKLCVRANISTSSSQNGHLSLFVHFMQGQHDSILSWPFCGKIVLSILDQNPNPQCCQHVTETLISKPKLAAFQKPTTPRNHKGFGYIEFMSLLALENRHYLCNDTLIIKAQVFQENEKSN